MSGVKLYRLLSLLAVLLLATMAAAPFPQAPANPGCPPAGCPAPGEMVVARVDYGIRARLDAVAALLPAYDALLAALRPVADIERIASRIALRSARPRDLSALRDSLLALPDLHPLLARLDSPLLTQLAGQ
ncbi:MAG TPA: hypothetical protein PKN11_10555, partial [Anaerolineaceae bacterium]|nr:hypothetical protein [Anaerolineaceae bacterium]